MKITVYWLLVVIIAIVSLLLKADLESAELILVAGFFSVAVIWMQDIYRLITKNMNDDEDDDKDIFDFMGI